MFKISQAFSTKGHINDFSFILQGSNEQNKFIVTHKNVFSKRSTATQKQLKYKRI